MIKHSEHQVTYSGRNPTLAEFVSQASLPSGAYGITAKVIAALQQRISKMPLSIEYIAEDLTLSKRTLQRRLQKQGVNFATLRDQVRFHYALDYLMNKEMDVDHTSSALDFHDRTSFTSAFKRWTGLAPSIFRKTYRDYV